MATKPPLVVIDTCVYVDVLYFGQGTDSAILDRAARSKNILEQMEAEGWRAGLAPVVKVELNSSTQLGGHHPQNVRHRRRAALDQYFGSSRYVLLENDERVTTLAALLARSCELKAPDALIAASAVAYGADFLYSWDADMLKLNEHQLMRSTRVISPPPVDIPGPPATLPASPPKPLSQLPTDSQHALFINEGAHE